MSVFIKNMKLKLKFKHLIIIGIIFVALGILASLGGSDKEKDNSSKDQNQVQNQQQSSEENDEVKEVKPDTYLVIRVIDGDTIEIEGGQKVRYIGINTPELANQGKPTQCFAMQAALANKNLVEGKKVKLVKDVSETDKYGRLLRYVYVGDIFVNDYLVRQGFAQVMTYPPDVQFKDQFLEAQKEAKDNNRGLWDQKVCPK